MISFNEAIEKNWLVIKGEAGYIGGNKKQIYANYNHRFGEFNWSKGHIFYNKPISKDQAIEIYEEGYYQYLSNNSDVLDWLTNTASEVYDLDPSNVNSGLDYKIQECNANHFQDISIRRVLKRLNRSFKGDHLVEIRGHKSEGYRLNPGQVPFHIPDAILNREGKTWWEPKSVEAFYQHNKILLVNPDKLMVHPTIKCPDDSTIYWHSKSTYYKPNSDPLILEKLSGKESRRNMHHNRQYKRLPKQKSKPYSFFLSD
tara:strand:- start:21945 stop:22715 length:771 start_codon:yes stop_codon:yes gene_type:complete